MLPVIGDVVNCDRPIPVDDVDGGIEGGHTKDGFGK